MDEAPSKTLLLERRAEKELVREGKSVLEDRRDLLAHMLVEHTATTEQLIAEVGRQSQHASRLFRRTLMRHGRGGLMRFSAVDSRGVDTQLQLRNRLGTPWVESQAVASEAHEELRPSWDRSLELEGLLRALVELLPMLLELACAENNLQRLVNVYRRTQRRVNALEHIVLPELDNTIAEMENRMDEMERDDLVRSFLIKRTSGRMPGEDDERV